MAKNKTKNKKSKSSTPKTQPGPSRSVSDSKSDAINSTHGDDDATSSVVGSPPASPALSGKDSDDESLPPLPSTPASIATTSSPSEPQPSSSPVLVSNPGSIDESIPAPSPSDVLTQYTRESVGLSPSPTSTRALSQSQPSRVGSEIIGPMQDLYSELIEGECDSEFGADASTTTNTKQGSVSLPKRDEAADDEVPVVESMRSDDAAFSGSKDGIDSDWSFAEATSDGPTDGLPEDSTGKEDDTAAVDKEVSGTETDVVAVGVETAATNTSSEAVTESIQLSKETPADAISMERNRADDLEKKLQITEAKLQAAENSLNECEAKWAKSEADRTKLQAALDLAQSDLATRQKEDAKLRDQNAKLRNELHDKSKHRYRLEADLKSERERTGSLEAQVLGQIPSELETASLEDRVHGLQVLLNKTRGDLAARGGELRKLERENLMLRLDGAKTKQEVVDTFGNSLDPQTKLYEAVQAYAAYRGGNGIRPSEEQMEEIDSFRSFMEARAQLFDGIFTAPDPWRLLDGFEKDWMDEVSGHDWAPLAEYRMSALRAYLLVRDGQDEKACGKAVRLMNSQAQAVRARAVDGTVWALVDEVNDMYVELQQWLERRRTKA